MAPSRKTFNFKGMMAPTFAPFNDDGSLNLSIIPQYAQLLHDGGVKGVYVNGTIGEGVSMTTSERKEVAEAWMKCRDMVGQVVVQVGGTNLKETQELAAHAESLGVSAIASLPPLFDKPTTIDDLVDHCRDVAAAAPATPFLYYHIPFKTGVELPMDEFLTVGAPLIPTLSGMKFTSMDVGTEGLRCLSAVGGGMTILSGFDQTLAQARRLGFPAAINGGFNFMALEAGRLFCMAGLPDDYDAPCCVPKEERPKEVSRIQSRMDMPWTIMARHSGGSTVSAAKLVMTLLTGVAVGPARKPQRPLPAAAATSLKEDLQHSGFMIHHDFN